MCNKNIEKKYKIIFENAGIPIYTISKDGKILEANKAAAELFETDLNNLIGKKIEDFYFNIDDRKVFLEALQKNKKLKNYHIKFKTAKNKIIDVLANVEMWDDEDSEILHQGTLVNITDLIGLTNKLKNLELMKYNAQLIRNLISDMKDKLTELLVINDLLQMTHNGNAYLIKSESLLENMSKLIGKYENLFPDDNITREKIDLANFLLEHKKLFKEIFSESLNITLVLNTENATIMSDYTQILQIFTSILQNSAEAIMAKGEEKGKIEIILNEKDIKGHTYLSDGKYIEIIIKDNGIGIKEDNLQNIFSVEYTAKAGKGKGLSLPVILSIINALNGDIKIESIYGVGTTVTILLPVLNNEEKNEHFDELELFDELDSNKTVFFVDDDDIIREAFAANLERKGFNVIQSNNPQDALEKLKEYFPLIDIAVIDIKMPGMTGGKLYETIKERYGHLPAIFISGYENDDEIKDIKNNFSFLKKPFSSDDLVNEINKNLKVDNKWMK